jgi:hypothetical protein
VIQCGNREKVLLASHQLEGPASDWWDAYVEAHEEPDNINWQEFKAAFRSHHVPHGVMKLKKKEFQDLKQGSMSVSEYVTRFTQLSRYAPNEVNTDEKKHDCFLNGLNDGLVYALEAQDFENFQGIVNKALVLQNHRSTMERKRKQERQNQQNNHAKQRIGSSSAGPVSRPVQQQQYQQRPHVVGQGYATPHRQMVQRPSNFQTPTAGNQTMQRPPASQNAAPNTEARKCFNCGEPGHFANVCPKPRASNPAAGATPSRNTNSATATARQNFVRGRVNHVAIDDA